MNRRFKERGLILIFLMVGSTLWGQKSWVATSGAPLDGVDLIELELDNSTLLASSRSIDKEEGPLRFAHEIKTNIAIQDAGTWETLDNEKMLWRQRIRSQGAYSLNFAFKDFHLPSSAVLFLYDVDRTHVIGPITQEDNDAHREWWSPIIPFDEVVIEIQVSPKEAKLINATITEVNHDFQGLGALLSGSCNVDVLCSEDDGYAIIDKYRDIINSVGMFTLNGRDQCSGALINNVRNDCTPYFLTAKHCEVTAENAASVVVYWNYQQSTCRTPGSAQSGSPGDGLRTMFNSGVSLISEYDNSDMALFLLDDPVAPDVNAFFAGWDATGIVIDSAICIHHPSVEEKRISFDFDPSTAYFNNQYYRVLDWDIGTTESGSSGSPLFSTEKRIVGQLNGGAADCGNEEYDDFGMLAISWEGGGTPGTSLKSWLDPDDTGVLTFGGRSCSDLITASSTTLRYCTLESRTQETVLSIESGYESGAQLSVRTSPDNVRVTFSDVDITPERPSVTMTIEIEEGYDATEGVIIVAIASSGGQDALQIALLVDTDKPSLPVLTFPRDGASNVSYDINLTWESIAQSHQIEIYEVGEAGNPSLVISEVQNNSLYPIKELKNNTTYTWRVRSSNSCGFGDYSNFFTFITGDVTCNLLNDTDLPQSIGFELDTIRSVITVDQEASVVDVNVINVRGKHTFVGDLIMELHSPSGTIVDLLSFRCSDADDFLVSFDDDSNIINTPCPINSQEPQRPTGSLADMIGESAKGDWTLIIYDDVREDGGSFDSWSLELCLLQGVTGARSITFSPSVIEICEKTPAETITIEGTISGGYDDTVTLELMGPITNDISISPNPVTGSGSRSFVIGISDTENFQAGTMLQLIARDAISTDTVSIASVSTETPETPVLRLPANNLIGIDLQPDFSWNATAMTNAYNVKIGTDAELRNIVLDTIVNTSEVQFGERLTVDTDYYWNVTSVGSCTDVSSEIFTFRTTVIDATRDLSLQEINMFPNPVSSELIIDVPAHLRSKQIKYEIINALGQVMEEQSLSSPTTKIDMTRHTSGVYYIKLESDKGLWTQAIFKL